MYTRVSADSAVPSERVFSQTYNTSLDWNTGIDLPSLSQGKWNLVPSVAIENADPGAAWMIRTQFTGADFVSQPKRLVYGLTISPTFFGLLPGIGDVARFRHSITPVITINYAQPSADQRRVLPGRGPVAGRLSGRIAAGVDFAVAVPEH